MEYLSFRLTSKRHFRLFVSLFKYCDLCNNSTSYQLVLEQVSCTAFTILLRLWHDVCWSALPIKVYCGTKNVVLSLTSVKGSVEVDRRVPGHRQVWKELDDIGKSFEKSSCKYWNRVRKESSAPLLVVQIHLRHENKGKDRPAWTPYVAFVVASHYRLQIVLLLSQACREGFSLSSEMIGCYLKFIFSKGWLCI